LQTYNKINRAIRRYFGKQIKKQRTKTKLRIHSIRAKAALKFGSEAWVLKRREEQRLQGAQMKFLRHLLGITKLENENNQTIREKLVVQNTVKEVKQYQRKWLQHVQRMDTNKIPKQTLQYRPKGRRNIGRPRKRWRDQLHLEDRKTGKTRLTLLVHDDDDDDDDDDDITHSLTIESEVFRNQIVIHERVKCYTGAKTPCMCCIDTDSLLYLFHSPFVADINRLMQADYVVHMSRVSG
jgi:hypothetical protein